MNNTYRIKFAITLLNNGPQHVRHIEFILSGYNFSPEEVYALSRLTLEEVAWARCGTTLGDALAAVRLELHTYVHACGATEFTGRVSCEFSQKTFVKVIESPKLGS